jgi:hypothetical protein
LVLLLVLNPALYGQGPGAAGDPPELVTDRPDVTEASTVIPKASIQVENGATFTVGQGEKVLDLSESLLRVGIANRTELRFGVPNYQYAAGGAGAEGFGNLSLGVKQQLGPLPGGIDLSVIVAISFPTGMSAVSSHGYDPFVKFPWSKELTRKWSIGGMQSVFWFTDGAKRNITWEPTFYLERQVTGELDVFAEYAGDYPQTGVARQIAHFGAAYKLTPHTMIDMHIGFGLSAAAPDQFVGIGYSIRFDRVFGATSR